MIAWLADHSEQVNDYVAAVNILEAVQVKSKYLISKFRLNFHVQAANQT